MKDSTFDKICWSFVLAYSLFLLVITIIGLIVR